MKTKTALIILVVAVAALVVYAFGSVEYISLGDFRRALAGIFFADSITEAQLHEVYAKALRGEGKVKVLIVPGHDDESWGTEYNGVREVTLTTAVGEALAAEFAKNKAYEVTLLRSHEGYLPAFDEYFQENKDAVRTAVTAKKKVMADLLKVGAVNRADGVPHNKAALPVALRLYAVNQWANEQGFHLVLHLHFNDYGGRKAGAVGKYSGFTLYFPDVQYSNAKASRVVADALFAQFSKTFTPSNLPKENGGMASDQSLIAVGAYNTLDPAAVLIEYAYIYESAIRNASTRAEALRGYAAETYSGVERFFGK